MKRIIYSMILGSLMLVTPSCSDDYLELFPTNAVDVGIVFSNTTNAMGALNGIHRMLYERFNSDQASGGQGLIMHMLDLLGEDMPLPARPNTLGGFMQWINSGLETGAETIFVWQFYYRIIANANLIIGNIDGAEGPQSERDMIKGQALAYRAWAHFMLVQIYGKRYDPQESNNNLGVPIMTFDSPEAKARNTVEEVYVQINADLDLAISLLDGYNRSNKSHINQSVARGFKARVLLTQGQWGAAAQMADLASEGYAFMSTAQQYEGYNDYLNPEWIWSHKIIASQQINYSSFFGYMGCNHPGRATSESPRLIHSVLYSRMAATDVRRDKLWIPDGATNPIVITPPSGMRRDYIHQKFFAEDGSTNGTGCVPCMRSAEMYLIAAEGYAKAGSSTLELARDRMFSLMRTRNPSYVRSIGSATQLIDDILIARRLELWGEGFRWLDLKRLNLPLDRTGANHIASVSSTMNVPAGDNRWQWKIPRNIEINANPLIIQNP
ncbi:MAG: RagB/SusD family nutrient uptake outer membrane protein [Bacteroidales bacterium]|nr:RagB/SusD family nutrient uptake outer membrane protein [Bacteroidales bacterium]MCL2132882.1 RagB/SusD family nutrient uptake outer membrane protein [Bacteroidales bacterium]